jgi:hypothetical protein
MLPPEDVALAAGAAASDEPFQNLTSIYNKGASLKPGKSMAGATPSW